MAIAPSSPFPSVYKPQTQCRTRTHSTTAGKSYRKQRNEKSTAILSFGERSPEKRRHYQKRQKSTSLTSRFFEAAVFSSSSEEKESSEEKIQRQESSSSSENNERTAREILLSEEVEESKNSRRSSGSEKSSEENNISKKERGSIVFVVGGGTGGHVHAALAVADEIRASNPSVDIHFIGTGTHAERKMLPEGGYRLHTVEKTKRLSLLSPSNLLVPVRFLSSVFQCWTLLGSLNPNAMVGTGGEVSVPACIAAFLRGVPVVLHEQNVSPSNATRFLAALARVVFVGFPVTADCLPSHKCVVTGNPVRSGLRRFVSSTVARAHFFPQLLHSHSGNVQVVLVLNGSLGEYSLNIAVLDLYSKMLAAHPNRYLIWQTGADNFDEMDSLVRHRHSRLFITAFLNDMDLAYAAADLVVSQAGAMTCSELLALGKPSILVPSTAVAEDHQVKNANFMSEAVGTKVLYEDQLNSTTVAEYIDETLDEESIMQHMHEMALKASVPDSTFKIAEGILSIVRRSS